jgi:plastocyanin
MKTLIRVYTLCAFAFSALAQSGSGSQAKSILALDNCDPTDPDWAPVGCFLREGKDNNVTAAEFNALVFSPLSLAVIGHPSWRFQPGYLTVETGKTLRLRNEGGRPHTFTPVAQFGGGRVPPLNNPGLFPAPECNLAPGATDPHLVPPGGTIEKTLAPGEHRLQCCFHPWMRVIVKVQDKN